MSKRVKITFDRSCDYAVIHPAEIAAINARIAKEMKPIIRDYKRKEYESWKAVKDKIKNC